MKRNGVEYVFLKVVVWLTLGKAVKDPSLGIAVPEKCERLILVCQAMVGFIK